MKTPDGVTSKTVLTMTDKEKGRGTYVTRLTNDRGLFTLTCGANTIQINQKEAAMISKFFHDHREES